MLLQVFMSRNFAYKTFYLSIESFNAATWLLIANRVIFQSGKIMGEYFCNTKFPKHTFNIFFNFTKKIKLMCVSDLGCRRVEGRTWHLFYICIISKHNIGTLFYLSENHISYWFLHINKPRIYRLPYERIPA